MHHNNFTFGLENDTLKMSTFYEIAVSGLQNTALFSSENHIFSECMSSRLMILTTLTTWTTLIAYTTWTTWTT